MKKSEQKKKVICTTVDWRKTKQKTSPRPLVKFPSVNSATFIDLKDDPLSQCSLLCTEQWKKLSSECRRQPGSWKRGPRCREKHHLNKDKKKQRSAAEKDGKRKKSEALIYVQKKGWINQSCESVSFCRGRRVSVGTSNFNLKVAWRTFGPSCKNTLRFWFIVSERKKSTL